jgi:uncharacterized protein (TIGR04255 family)
LLEQAVTALFEAYPTDVATLKPTQGVLRYINVLDYPSAESPSPLLVFLKEKLHTEVIPEPLLFDDPKQALQPNVLTLNLAYRLTDPAAVAGVNFSVGTANGKPSLIFEITVQTPPGNAPQSAEDFLAWIKDSLSIVDKWFFALIRGPLLEEFNKTNAN